MGVLGGLALRLKEKNLGNGFLTYENMQKKSLKDWISLINGIIMLKSSKEDG
jgi:hypothetical protein